MKWSVWIVSVLLLALASLHPRNPTSPTSVIVSTMRELSLFSNLLRGKLTAEESGFEARPPILYGPNSCLTAGGCTRGFGREGEYRSSKLERYHVVQADHTRFSGRRHHPQETYLRRPGRLSRVGMGRRARG